MTLNNLLTVRTVPKKPQYVCVPVCIQLTCATNQRLDRLATRNPELGNPALSALGTDLKPRKCKIWKPC